MTGEQIGQKDEHGNLTNHMSSLMNSSSPGSSIKNESNDGVNNATITPTVTKVRTPRNRQKKAVAPYTVPSEQISPVSCIYFYTYFSHNYKIHWVVF